MMNREELPTEVWTTTHTSKSSPMKSFAALILRELRRPSRLRSRILISFILISSVIFLFLGRWHAYKIERTASHLGNYVPNKLTGAFPPYDVIEGGGLNNTIPDNDTNTEVARPKFHLIIPTRKRSVNLCKTLVSAAILNYPPPTLIGFELEEKEGNDRLSSQYIQDTLNFLNGKEVNDDDMVFILDEDTWLQLPVEIIISRFLRDTQDSNASLLKQYGRVDTNNSMFDRASPKQLRLQKYTQKVLFAAQKKCSIGDGPAELACYANSIPQSTLPKKNHKSKADKYEAGIYNRPRFIEGALAVGKAGDVRRVWKKAEELVRLQNKSKKDTSVQKVLTQIFGEQEWNRSQSRKASSSKFRIWLEEKMGYGVGVDALATNNIMFKPEGASENYEFGIGLDYSSRVFQTMQKSSDDLRFVRYGDKQEKGIVRMRGVIKGQVENSGILPAELKVIEGPLELCGDGDVHKEGEITKTGIENALMDAKKQNITWRDVQLGTNIKFPGTSVPASLNFNFHGKDIDEGAKLKKELWGNMWWRRWDKSLLKACTSSSGAEQAWKNVVGDGEIWWDLRGGRGGVWTGERVWIEWGKVCGGEEFEEEVFGDA
ncbi:07cc15af-3585-4830-b6f6-5b323db1c25e [Sclerotinia trifoliorum]|uniref:07cc15af-3585-4830-b6f6-5b323db1c25e n=1 Tax=Sclerotinia trifoliorum TaxID=28548 RepID=A0A8H2VP99_9HELO|nr:07cc15af-3585-4830-b6f6-5b323db1c25e [Sclerotinia trifoliorum]